MLNKTKYLLASTSVLVCMLSAATSYSETIVRETVTKTVPGATSSHTVVKTETPGVIRTETRVQTEEHSTAATGTRVINFMEFDLNNDTILSVNEIGQMLFKLYDTDGNEIIDNTEYERRSVVTVMPMEKNTVISYDLDGDGKTDVTKYSYEAFTKDTLLTRYDANKDGLSPHEFMGMYFNEADINNDHSVDLKEWQGSYIASIDKKNKEKAHVNK